MASSNSKMRILLIPRFLTLLVAMVAMGGGATELDVSFYESSCPDMLAIVRRGVHVAMQDDPRMPASLLRLHFHDCFVNGCDGSNLLDDRPGFVGEKTSTPNLNSARGFSVVDEIKRELEAACPGTVSCADIVAAAARDAVVLSGGPFWDVELGRHDALTASRDAANNEIPKPTFTVAQLVESFRAVGLDEKDVVALSGSHTIGKARCTSFQARIDNQAASLNGAYRASLQRCCPHNNDGNATSPLDPCSPTVFDNAYFRNLLAEKGLLASDQTLATTPGVTRQLVAAYATDQALFFRDFAEGMRKMGRSRVLGARDAGEVRRNCRVPNQ